MSRLAIGVLLGGLACGSVEDTTIEPTETPPIPSVECPDESVNPDAVWELVTLELAPQDDAAQCLRTEPADRVTVPFCVDLMTHAGLRWVCDDAGPKYMVVIQESFIAPTGFSLCEPPGAFYERPCHTRCDPTLGTPWLPTVCGEEETRLAARCGESDSAYDENCCKRLSCFDGVCPAGMSCEDIYVATFAGIHPQLGGCRASGPSFPMPTPYCVPIP
jgi:hypothetical protein